VRRVNGDRNAATATLVIASSRLEGGKEAALPAINRQQPGSNVLHSMTSGVASNKPAFLDNSFRDTRARLK